MKKFWIIILIIINSQIAIAGNIKPNILFVPLDDRPVCYSFVKKIGEKICPKFLTLDKNYLSKQADTPAKVDLAWKWVFTNSPTIDIAILSTDTLLYGGLIPSRKHELSLEAVNARVNNFKLLKKKYPKLRIYAFTTIPRSPNYNTNGTGPFYYDQYGAKIFKINALNVKKELTGKLSISEDNQLAKLKTEVPIEYLIDYLAKRKINFQVNQELINLTKQGIIDYLILAKDDNGIYTLSHLEYLKLAKEATELTISPFKSLHKFNSFCGADEIGLILLARAFNNYKLTKIYPNYPNGHQDYIPNFEDESFAIAINKHIEASGAVINDTKKNSDLILEVNTPYNLQTKLWGGNNFEENLFKTNKIMGYNKFINNFIIELKKDLKLKIPVSIADVSFSNGGDSYLLKQLADNNLLYQLSGYAGWNTAGNAIGFAIPLGVLNYLFTPKFANSLLTIRYLDDVIYQTKVRKLINNEYLKTYKINPDNLSSAENFPFLLIKTQTEMKKLYDYYQLKELPNFQVKYPWNRNFEIEISTI